jgi:DNA-binding beta-propeller fold protein YncE
MATYLLHRYPLTLAGTIAAVLLLAAANEPNAQPNPYRTIENWGKLPNGRTWGSAGGVAVDAHDHVWVAERCGANSCADSKLDPILEFDTEGNFLKSFGGGIFVFPHGMAIDRDGNIWLCDGQGKDGKGQQVFKFSPDGKILLTLGKAGVAGTTPDTFNMPSDVAIAPNGDIFVADGHGGDSNNRIVKFDKNGKYIKEWGHKGAAPGEFDIPHAVAFDAKGRLYVGDRNNNRIQIFDQNGTFIEQWTQFSRPSGIFIDKHGAIYVADSESGSSAKTRTDWKRGIRVGNIKDGIVTALIPDPAIDATGTSAAESVGVDSKGAIYGAEVGPKDVKKYVKK